MKICVNTYVHTCVYMYMSVCVCIQIYAYYVTRKHIQTHTCTCTHTHTQTNTILSHMGWLRLAGSFKLLVSFAKESYKRDDILQQRPTILRSLLIIATSYHVDLQAVCMCVCVHLCVCRVVEHDSFTCLTWLIHMCDMTHSYV